MLWIPCFPAVIITIDLSVLEEGYPKDILVAGSTIQMVIKFLQQVGCIFVVSLAVKVLVPYVSLPHYILVMDAANCIHWIRSLS